MPDPNRLIRTLQQAARDFRNTPGRRGHLIDLPKDAVDLLVSGDLHGNVDNFRGLLDRADMDRHAHRHIVFQEVVHGPNRYPQGGDTSHQLIDLVAALKCQYPRRVHFLLGNHELSQWTGQRIAKADIELNDLFIEGVNNFYGERGQEIYNAYLNLFAMLPLAIRTANRIFLSHSLPATRHGEFPSILENDHYTDRDIRAGGPLHALVWGRDTRLATVAAFLQRVNADLLITGHIRCEQGWEAPNERQLILDTLGEPAAYCLFPLHRSLTHAELMACVSTL